VLCRVRKGLLIKRGGLLLQRRWAPATYSDESKGPNCPCFVLPSLNHSCDFDYHCFAVGVSEG
jgi:hypothetical protein